MLIRYFKGAGSSLFISILIYLLTVPIYKEYLTSQLGVSLYTFMLVVYWGSSYTQFLLSIENRQTIYFVSCYISY
jgi:hypothetical protein